ncbi:MAG: Phosphoglycerate mutase [uncultured Acidimicrobiales bacterium]|uniref:Phosphoglycerate mutase n=1 Tax=uncultured Acidimicrobiales bacterium TaxID=310071 RepID=A0A6J4ILZ0_9ACTN|nr:MAG: Phosphoglycerate mutase [uncultured Acidimicrobiales bacterium]
MAARTFRQPRFRKRPGSTELILVRHGESEPAVPGRPFASVEGHGDPALAPEGRAQALAVAERLADQQLDAIYVTDLRRTAETAAPLAARLGVTPAVEPGLREVHLGEWEGGILRQKMAEGDPLGARMVAEERWDVVPGAEPSEAFARRVREAVVRIITAHPDQRVAVFTHGGVIGELLRQATRSSRGFAFVGSDNGSISHLVADGERWVLRRYNDTSHLGGGLDLDPTPDLPGDDRGPSA